MAVSRRRGDEGETARLREEVIRLLRRLLEKVKAL